jgi:hypothetical protein
MTCRVSATLLRHVCPSSFRMRAHSFACSSSCLFSSSSSSTDEGKEEKAEGEIKIVDSVTKKIYALLCSVLATSKILPLEIYSHACT